MRKKLHLGHRKNSQILIKVFSYKIVALRKKIVDRPEKFKLLKLEWFLERQTFQQFEFDQCDLKYF
jgi:hypothetical protein